MKTCFFTIIGDNYYYPEGTPKMINSFKKFHPDIDLVVFRQDMIDKVFAEKHVNFYNSKPTFAKLLTPYYDLVVNIDADHVIIDRLDEILVGDYDVAAPWNFNSYENSHFEHITDEMYIQGGLIASTSKKFWDVYEEMNKTAMNYVRKENDILNLIWFGDFQFKKKILDKDKPLYYGCKLLGKENECYVKDSKLWCGDSQVKLYHNAKGLVFPKLNFTRCGFQPEVVQFLDNISMYGTTMKIGSI